VTCEIPGCAHRMAYSGRGAPPKYCGQTVAGVRHTRLTAYRLSKGQITLPAPDGGVPHPRCPVRIRSSPTPRATAVMPGR
jgi:hypothetical protein